jgi:ribokinase
VVVAPLEVPRAAIAAAFGQARAAGARTMVNLSPVSEVGALLGLSDVVVVNEHEAAALAGVGVSDVQAAPDVVAAELAEPGQVVVVTLGGQGVAAGGDGLGASRSLRLAGVAVATVDTTGAGDCFGGVLAAGLADGLALPAALERANRAAALSVTRMGTVPAMPTLAEVLAVAPGTSRHED